MTLHLRAMGYHLGGQYSIYLPQKDGRLSWLRWPVTYRGDIPTSPTIMAPLMVTLRSTDPAVRGWESNSWPVDHFDHKSDALTITLPSQDHLCTRLLKLYMQWWMSLHNHSVTDSSFYHDCCCVYRPIHLVVCSVYTDMLYYISIVVN